MGLGTYFGLIAVFLKSNPTSEVPRGIIAPPYILLSLKSSLSAVSKSKLVVKSKGGRSFDVVPFLNKNVFVAVGIKPGLLSTTCSPGYSKIVVFPKRSLSSPFWYENLDASIKAR